MAYYKWVALDTQGSICRGKRFARSSEALDAYLQNNLLRPVIIKKIISGRTISLKTKTHLCYDLATLLKSGIRLPEALTLVSKTIKDSYIQNVLGDMAQAIEEGIPLSKTFLYYEKLWTSLDAALIHAGELSGNIGVIFEELAYFYEAQCKYSIQKRRVLYMPIITLIFSFIIMIGFLTIIVPRFKMLFTGRLGNTPLPYMTSLVFSLSDWLRAPLVWGIIVSSILLVVIVVRYCSRFFWNGMRSYVPLYRGYARHEFLASWFTQVSLMLKANIPLTKIIEVSHHFDEVICSNDIVNKLQSGVLLSDALLDEWLFKDEFIVGLIKVGERTATLPKSLNLLANYYHSQLDQMRNRIVVFLQPLLLILLGTLIMCMVVALYAPLFTFSSIISH